jgi:hypothetical protein
MILQSDLEAIGRYELLQQAHLAGKNVVPHFTRSDKLTNVTPVLPLESECTTRRERSYVTRQISVRIRENTMRVKQINKPIINFKLGAEILGRLIRLL